MYSLMEKDLSFRKLVKIYEINQRLKWACVLSC